MAAAPQIPEGENWWLYSRPDATESENIVSLSNSISTTKYNLLTWLPVSLGNQFKRVANIYFAAISVLMLIGKYAPQIFPTPLDPYSTIVTFIFVLSVTCLKEGSEDFQRFQDDKFANEKKVIVVTFDADGKAIETEKQTQEIQGGDIVKLVGPTMQVPVDMLLCMSSNFADGNQCYIETANIDGETNLKLKNAPSDLADLSKDGVVKRELFEGKLEFQPPNKSIYTFIGAYHCKASGNPDGIPLGPENVLLRSSLFSNTDWGYGIAIYTGQETKIQMNNRKSESKMSGIEKLANSAIKAVFCAQLLLVSITVISVYAMKFNNKEAYLPYVNVSGGGVQILPLWLQQFCIFFLLFNNFIPISLYVTIELVNLGQGYLISGDPTIYDEKLDLQTGVKSSNLAQELGMVSNIFSDKTGTLTCNEMRFVKFIIDGEEFDVDPALGVRMPAKALPGTHLPNKDIIYNFVRCLTTCHTVIREKDGTYRAESPDELALVEGAAKLNCFVKERGTIEMKTSLFGEDVTYQVLAVNAFNSERKRMSVILKSNKGEYFMMCKGADNIMVPLCKISAESEKSVKQSLYDLACKGLRTLVIGQKKLDTKVAEKWLEQHSIAASAMEDRAAKLDKIAAEIEMGMDLLGITAIEDRLQDEVPQVIASLADAGIVLWMLTGDKEETAINIGRSCELIINDTKLFMLCGGENPKNDAEQKEAMVKYNDDLKSIYEDIEKNWVDGGTPQTTGYKDPATGEIITIVLVMDGPTFAFFDYDKPEQTKWFLRVGEAVRSVIACRLTPNQKESVVHLVKVNTIPKATCLSIGDGANDVSMILEADVGVGIYGKEGRQAANNADFAIGQFKFLKDLLLKHGRWNYIRQSQVFLYSLHKNAVITFLLFWFTYYTAVSGTSPFQSWVYSGYNLILGLPVVCFGIMDRDLSASFVLNNPQVYESGRTNQFLNVNTVLGWVGNAICYAIILSTIFYYGCFDTFKEDGLYIMGTTAYTGLVMALQGKMAFLHHQWAYPQIFFMVLSIGGMLFYYWMISFWTFDSFYAATSVLYARPSFWLMGMFTAPLIMMVFEAIAYYGRLFFSPTKEMYYREVMNRETFVSDCMTTKIEQQKSAAVEMQGR